MSAEPTIERRLAALEAAVKEIQERIGLPPSAEKWWEKIPPVQYIEAFEEAMEYGRAYRHADRPPDEPGEQGRASNHLSNSIDSTTPQSMSMST